MLEEAQLMDSLNKISNLLAYILTNFLSFFIFTYFYQNFKLAVLQAVSDFYLDISIYPDGLKKDAF